MTDKETNSEQTKPATATSTTKMSQPVGGAASSAPPNSSTSTPPNFPLPNLGGLANPDLIAVTIAPFTGGPFTMAVNRNDTIEELKKTVAKKLKVLKDRICLLYRERQLSEGTLAENALVEGSRITLLPRAETGLLAQKPEQSVMQALESLSDSQVVDFLSGKAPLNLTMRLGDHMMLIQLQLSTVNSHHSSKRAKTSSSTGSTASSGTESSSTSSSASASSTATSSASSPSSPSSPSSSSSSSSASYSSSSSSTTTTASGASSPPVSSYKPKLDTRALAEASKNLTQTLKQLSSEVLTTRGSSSTTTTTPLSSTGATARATSEQMRSTSNGSGYKSRSNASQHVPSASSASSSSNSVLNSSHRSQNKPSDPVTSSASSATSSSSVNKSSEDEGQTGSHKNHRKRPRHSSGGAIIESMHHHGKGVYSGTFSGTLNPALQDRNGQPKRDITTIIHILNDLLCAQYKNYQTSSSGTRSKGTNGTSKNGQNNTSKTNPSSQGCGSTPSGAEMFQQTIQEQLQVTKSKMEALRKVMEERKARRRARREARAAPYSTSWSVKSEQTGDSNPASPSDEAQEASSSSSSSSQSGTNTNPGGPAPPSDNLFNTKPEPVTA